MSVIDVQQLAFRYPGSERRAVAGMAFAVEAGEIFGFLGPSGAGKSTTQKILTGLLRGYTGKAAVIGREIDTWGSDYFQRVGVSFELPNHFQKLTALENLEFFRSLYAGKTADPMTLLADVGLTADAGTRVSHFSKGMQMRLIFARALLNCPELLFLDEPTSGLDPVNARQIEDLILRERDRGCTVFLTTHSMTVADRLCDRVAFVVDGEARLIDSPRALKLRHGRRLVAIEYRDGVAARRREFPLDGISDNVDFLDLLRTADLETIHTEEATLEDIFIQVTGRSLQ